MGELVHQIDDVRLPVFVGAGVIKSEEAMRQYAAIPELAVQVVGSFSADEYGGNDPSGEKRVFYYDEEHQAAYNAVGLKNCGWEAASKFLPEAINAAHAAGQLVVVAITSLKHEAPQAVLPDLAEQALEAGADGVELTLSCPNEGPHPVLCLDVYKSLDTVAKVRQRIGPQSYLLAKMSPLSEHLASRYEESGAFDVDAITAVNTCLRPSPPDAEGHPVIDVNNGYAGESGPILADLALENLERLHNLSRPPSNAARGRYDSVAKASYDIWSIGGVVDGHEVYERKHKLGAYLVGGAQALYRSDDPARVIKRWAAEYTATALLTSDS